MSSVRGYLNLIIKDLDKNLECRDLLLRDKRSATGQFRLSSLRETIINEIDSLEKTKSLIQDILNKQE